MSFIPILLHGTEKLLENVTRLYIRINLYTCIYIYMYIYTYVCIYKYLYICTHLCTCVYIYMYIYTCMYIIYTYVYIYIYIYMYICMYTLIHNTKKLLENVTYLSRKDICPARLVVFFVYSPALGYVVCEYLLAGKLHTKRR